MPRHTTPATPDPAASSASVPFSATVNTSPRAALAAQRLTDLLASVRDIPSLNPLAGIMSGPGNQGTNCPANLQGQSGTAGTLIGIPRTLGPPGSYGGTPV